MRRREVLLRGTVSLGNRSEAHRWLYLAVPRTGCRYTFGALRPAGFVGCADRPEIVTHDIGVVPAGWSVVAGVRHPLNRMVGVWRWVRRTAAGWPAEGPAALEGFAPFVRLLCSRPGLVAARPISGYLGSIEPDIVLRFETLPRDIAALPFPTRVDAGAWRPQPWREHYTAELEALVLKLWEADLRWY